MALTNYNELKTSIADFLNRDDLTNIIPDFITFAETNINRDIRHWRMEKRANAVLDTQYTALPTDFIEPIRLTINTANTKPLEVVGNFEIATIRSEIANTTGEPKYYTIIDGAIEVLPRPDKAYTLELLYYGRIPPLNAQTTTNWLLQYHPDILLYGSLIHSAPYLADDTRIPVWGAYYASAVAKLNDQSENARSGGSGRRMKIRSYV